MPKRKLENNELPAGFSYPTSFEVFLASSGSGVELEPWGFVADTEADARYGPKCERTIVQFAQAWLEDMTASFVVGPDAEPRVVVLNPWADQLVDGEWKKVCQVIEELPSFEAWLAWVKDSDLVKDHAEARAQRQVSE